jgi:hypothetical protein
VQFVAQAFVDSARFVRHRQAPPCWQGAAVAFVKSRLEAVDERGGLLRDVAGHAVLGWPFRPSLGNDAFETR